MFREMRAAREKRRAEQTAFEKQLMIDYDIERAARKVRKEAKIQALMAMSSDQLHRKAVKAALKAKSRWNPDYYKKANVYASLATFALLREQAEKTPSVPN